MLRLPLEEAFPDALILPQAEGPLMPAWAGLLAAPPEEAAAALADLLGLPTTVAADLASRTTRVALLAPRTSDRRDALRFRSLVLAWSEGGFLLFRGNEHWLPFDWPPDYRGPLSRLGLVSFTGQDEIFADTGPEGAAIARILSEAGVRPPERLRPFYTDGADRTSLWLGDDTSRAWIFDRASRELRPESEGGFPGWFATHLAASARF